MKIILIILLNLLFISCFPQKVKQVNHSSLSVNDKSRIFEIIPIWSDEFNELGKPDPLKWSYDTGGHGWGNNELQYYTNGGNVNIANGVLTITAKKEINGSNAYTSCRLSTKAKGDFLYGRFEIKAKLPSGRGTWPAIWMLPTDFAYGKWPNSGEIDIMEHVGYDQNKIHITVHTGAFNHAIKTQVGKSIVVPTASADFHKYRVDWTPHAVKGFIDDEQIFDFTNNGQGFKTWPFDKRFHLLLNLAVGGNWGGQKGIDENAFPAGLEVDYVRVYKMIEK